MDKKCRQHKQIVLYPEERDGRHCIRIGYAGNLKIAHLLCSVDNVGITRIDKERCNLLEFYDRFSPHAYIDYNKIYVRHPNSQRKYTLSEGYFELFDQKWYSPSTKTYRTYFCDFMEYYKRRNIDSLKVADISKYILYLVNKKKIFILHRIYMLRPLSSIMSRERADSPIYIYGDITHARNISRF